MTCSERRRLVTCAILLAGLAHAMPLSGGDDGMMSRAPFILTLPDGWQMEQPEGRYQLSNGGDYWRVLYYPPNIGVMTLEQLILVQDAAMKEIAPGSKVKDTVPLESKSAYMRIYDLPAVPPEKGAYLVAGAVLEHGAIAISGLAPKGPALDALRRILLSAKSR
jgi:hypothetical protein